MGGRPLGASVDLANDRMVFTYPDPMENELHILKFDSPIVVNHGAFSVTHIYHGNEHSASCRKVYVAELSLQYGRINANMFGTIAFPMWSDRFAWDTYRMTLSFESEKDGYEWLDGDVIPSW